MNISISAQNQEQIERKERQVVQQQLETFRKDARWYDDHYDELRVAYPDHWIAVYKGRVVAASPDEDEMFAQLKRKKLLATKALIKYLSTREETWMFSVR